MLARLGCYGLWFMQLWLAEGSTSKPLPTRASEAAEKLCRDQQSGALGCKVYRLCQARNCDGPHCDAEALLRVACSELRSDPACVLYHEPANAPTTRFSASVTLGVNKSLGAMLKMVQVPAIRNDKERQKVERSPVVYNFHTNVAIRAMTPDGAARFPQLRAGMTLVSVSGTAITVSVLKVERVKRDFLSLANVVGLLKPRPVTPVFIDEHGLFRAFAAFDPPATSRVLGTKLAGATEAVQRFCGWYACDDHERGSLLGLLRSANADVLPWVVLEAHRSPPNASGHGGAGGMGAGGHGGAGGMASRCRSAETEEAHLRLPEGASITGFYHASINSPVWHDVVAGQLATLHRGPLYNASSSVLMSVLGSGPFKSPHNAANVPPMEQLDELEGVENKRLAALLSLYPKVQLEVRSTDTSHFEAPTLSMLKQYCDSAEATSRPDALVYYLHSKSVTRWRSPQQYQRVTDWREYMEHYLFERPELCVNALLNDGATSCGVNFYGDHNGAHFGGNFWWARCDYVRTLEPPTPHCWTCGETWLLSALKPPFSEARSLCDSKVDHYMTPFPRKDWPDVEAIRRNITMTWPTPSGAEAGH